MNTEELLIELVNLMNEQNNLIAKNTAAVTVLTETLKDYSIKPINTTRSKAEPLTQDDFDALDEEIDLDWWYDRYGESPRPAKAMNQQGVPFNRKETDYLFRRLVDIASVSPEVNGGTHTFQYLGKTYVKSEKNTLNCFACIPVTK